MSPMKRATALRQQLLLCFALLVAGIPTAHAKENVFTEAWDCAKGSAEAAYELAGKGKQALEVLGSAPQCVAYATAGDVSLYATTGALFTLNAIDSSVVSSNDCVNSVQANAVVPMAKLLNGALPDGAIPPDLLEAGSQEAAEQLWDFMATTPPLNEAIDRIDCGCTFLEAGLSVQNLVEIFTIIAQAGEQCDAMLENVPGYQTVKAGVKAGGTAMNNLGEDIFTGQTQHKDVEAYYFHDFDGGVDSYATRSHAAARILDPGHNWRTQEGASFLSETDVKLGGGANNGSQYKNTCMAYFDSHKMSSDNADEVCEAMVQRFDYDYKSMVPRMAAQDTLVKQLDIKLKARVASGKAACDQQFPPEGAQVGSGNLYASGINAGPHNDCIVHMAGSAGSLDWHSPYDAVGSLGLPLDPEDVTAMLATGKPWFFMQPTKMSGARKIAWEALENNGGDSGKALAQGLLAYDMMRDKILKDAHAHKASLVLLEKQQKEAKVKNAAGAAFSHCPAAPYYQGCIDALGDAVEVCLAQVGTVPIKKEFPSEAEEAKIQAIYDACSGGYIALADAYAKRRTQESFLRNSLVGTCPPAGEAALRANCQDDIQSVISSCQGGAPHLSTGYFASKKFAQDPTPEVDCGQASALFKDKWTTDDQQIGRINSATPEALKACNAKVPDFAACQEQVGMMAASCRTDLQQTANVLLGSLALQSEELGNAKLAIKENADACIAQMMAIADKMGAGHEAEVIMLAQYGPRCGRNQACKDLLSETLRQCQGPSAAASGAVLRANPALSRRSTSAGVGQPRLPSGPITGAGVGASMPNATSTQATGVVFNQAAANAGPAGVDSNLFKAHSSKLANSHNPVTVALNNPSAFSASGVNPVLADTPANDVLKCKDELEAALAKFDHSQVPNASYMPATSVNSPVLPPNATPGVVGRARPTRNAPAAPAAPVLYNMPSLAKTVVSIQAGMDRMGGDFKGFALDEADPQQCRQACANEAACKSYTYVNPGIKGPQAMCFLKNTIPPATANDCCTSGQKSEPTRNR